jgi:C4-dicarboxylate-specific signal transduction histidine kinase
VKIVKDGDKDVTCNGYPRELLQVLMILLQNALEALVGRGIVNGKISIKTEQKNDEIILSVSDNAGGVNKEYIEKIWEPYFTTKQTAQGSGLGLYVAHKLVQEKLRGKLHVENQANGACFTLRFQKRL